MGTASDAGTDSSPSATGRGGRSGGFLWCKERRWKGHLEVRQRNGSATSKRLQRAEARANVLYDQAFLQTCPFKNFALRTV